MRHSYVLKRTEGSTIAFNASTVGFYDDRRDREVLALTGMTGKWNAPTISGKFNTNEHAYRAREAQLDGEQL